MKIKKNATSKSFSFNNGNLSYKRKVQHTNSAGVLLREEDKETSLNLLSIVLVILLIALIFTALSGDETKTFTAFLEMLNDMPQISTRWIIDGMGSFVIPDIPFIGALLDILWSVITFVTVVFSGLVNALIFAFSFVRWLVV